MWSKNIRQMIKHPEWFGHIAWSGSAPNMFKGRYNRTADVRPDSLTPVGPLLSCQLDRPRKLPYLYSPEDVDMKPYNGGNKAINTALKIIDISFSSMLVRWHWLGRPAGPVQGCA